jgi:hypothetical protein
MWVELPSVVQRLNRAKGGRDGQLTRDLQSVKEKLSKVRGPGEPPETHRADKGAGGQGCDSSPGVL